MIERAPEGEFTGASVPQPVAPRSKTLWWSLGGAGAVALLAIAAAGFLLLSKAGPNVERMVPDSADVYAFVYLDPPLAQKVNLLNLAHKFPDLKTDQDIMKRINDGLNAGLKDAGLSFESDVKPWLGSQLAFFVQIADKPQAAMLIDSRDDTKAKAFLAKLRSGDEGKKYTWKDETYQGVTISVGTPKATQGAEPTIYAYTDRTMIFSSSVAYVHDVIDAGKGKKGRVVDSAAFKATMSKLPAERLGFIYVNGKPVVDQIKKAASGQGSNGLQLPTGSLKQLDGFAGVAFSVTARPNGLMGDLEIRLDSSKLDQATRNSLSTPAHPNRVTGWVPPKAYALFTMTGLNQAINSALDSATPNVRQGLNAFGLTGSGSPLAHLTGDAGIELEAGGGSLPVDGALLLGTDDPAGMLAFLDKFVSMMTQGPQGPSQGVLPGQGSQRPSQGGVTFTRTNYKGVTVTSVSIPQLSQVGYGVSYAVTGGMTLVATSNQEIKAIIDAHGSGQSISQNSQFMSMSKEVDGMPSSLLYVDIAEVVKQIQQRVPAVDRLESTKDAFRNAGPLKVFIMTVRSTPDQVSEKTFLRIE
jgi:hypothetical protein